MSVQNLREKFNQPSKGAVSPPGTSFGTIKSPPTPKTAKIGTIALKNEPLKKKSTPFGSTINGNRPSNFRTSSQNENTFSVSDRLLNNTPKPYVNGNCLDAGKTTSRKSPEQSQQDIILRKWNRNGVTSSGDLPDGISSTKQTVTSTPTPSAHTKTRNSESPFSTLMLSKPKNVLSRYISQLTVDEKTNDCDEMSSENEGTIPPERAEHLKNKYEINDTSNTAPSKWDQPLLNGGTNRRNPGFLNSVRSKMNGDATTNKVNGSNLNGCGKSATAKPFCNGLKRSTNDNHEEKQIRNTQTNKVLLPTQDYSSLEKKYHALQKDHEKLKRELKERSDQLTQLRTLSEAMYKEYDQLRNQYNLETSTMHQAMERATQWYKQNRELKRQSTALMQHVIAMKPDALSEMGDEVDTYSEQDSEIEALRKTIQDLTRDMSKVQAELNSIKLKENEAQEQIVYLTQQLESERRAALSTDGFKLKERRTSFETNNHSDNLEDKLRATEAELQLALNRANQAEAETATLSNKVLELETELQEIKQQAASAPPAPPAPPPPPPPPPLPMTCSPGLNNISNVVLRKSNGRADQTEDSAAEQMADLLGIPKKSGLPKVQGGAIDDIINEIKGGRFSLKATEKQSCVKKEEPPPVVHEMMNVLGTLRRQPNRKKDCSVDQTTENRNYSF